MKICLCHKDISTIDRGGVCMLMKNLAEGFCDQGHEVYIVTQQEYYYPGIKTIKLPIVKDKKAYSELVSQTIKDLDFDIIECSSWGFELLSYLKTDSHKSKVVIRSEPAASTLFETEIYAESEIQLLNNADCIIAVSEFAKQDLLKKYNIKNEIHVIYNSVDISSIKSETKKHVISSGEILTKEADWKKITNLNISELIPKDQINIFWIGKPTRMKGYDYLINIISNVKSRKLPINFIINIGWSDEYVLMPNEIKNQITMVRGLSRSDQLSLWSYNDLFISTSRFEGFGLVIIESAALNLPILFNKECKVYEEFIQSSWGISFDPINVEDTVEKIFSLKQNRNKYTFQNLEYFSRERLIQETLNLYSKIK